MRPYAEQTGLLAKEEIAMLYQIRDVVEALPDIDLSSGKEKKYVSCHLLARALGKFFHLTVVDGHFMWPGVPHSWLVNERGKIFDVYPIAQVGGPVLFDNFRFCPWPKLFVEAEIHGLMNDEFIHHLLHVEGVVEKTMQELRLLPRPQKPFVWAPGRGSARHR